MHLIARQIVTLQLLHISTAVLFGLFIKEMQEHSCFVLPTPNIMECQKAEMRGRRNNCVRILQLAESSQVFTGIEVLHTVQTRN